MDKWFSPAWLDAFQKDPTFDADEFRTVCDTYKAEASKAVYPFHALRGRSFKLLDDPSHVKCLVITKYTNQRCDNGIPLGRDLGVDFGSSTPHVAMSSALDLFVSREEPPKVHPQFKRLCAAKSKVDSALKRRDEEHDTLDFLVRQGVLVWNTEIQSPGSEYPWLTKLLIRAVASSSPASVIAICGMADLPEVDEFAPHCIMVRGPSIYRPECVDYLGMVFSSVDAHLKVFAQTPIDWAPLPSTTPSPAEGSTSTADSATSSEPAPASSS